MARPVSRRAAKADPEKAKPKPRIIAPSKAEKAAPAFDRRAATASITNKLNRSRDKNYGPGTVTVATEVIVPDRATTGALAFDVAMSGGFPVNQWTEVVGLENAGKTTVILKALAKLQQDDPDYTCVWVASESFDPDLADKCGVDRSRILLVEENVMEVAFQVVLEYVEGRGCDMVVVDSYPSMVTLEEDGKTMDEHTMGGAKKLNLFMRKCTKASKRSLSHPELDRPFTGILVNQWREKIGVVRGDPRTTSGGKGKNYWMYARLDVKRDEWLLNSRKEKVGQVIKIVCFKMKGARPQQVGVVDFYFTEHGEFKAGDYDDFKQVFNLALYFDVIGRSGNGYLGPEGQFIKSKDLLIQTLQSDVEWRARIEADVLRLARQGKAPVDIDDDDEGLQLVSDDEEAPKPVRRIRKVPA